MWWWWWSAESGCKKGVSSPNEHKPLTSTSPSCSCRSRTGVLPDRDWACSTRQTAATYRQHGCFVWSVGVAWWFGTAHTHRAGSRRLTRTALSEGALRGMLLVALLLLHGVCTRSASRRKHATPQHTHTRRHHAYTLKNRPHLGRPYWAFSWALMCFTVPPTAGTSTTRDWPSSVCTVTLSVSIRVSTVYMMMRAVGAAWRLIGAAARRANVLKCVCSVGRAAF